MKSTFAVLIVLSFINQIMTSNSTENFTASIPDDNSTSTIAKAFLRRLNFKNLITILFENKPNVFPGKKKESKKIKTLLGCMKLNTCY